MICCRLAGLRIADQFRRDAEMIHQLHRHRDVRPARLRPAPASSAPRCLAYGATCSIADRNWLDCPAAVAHESARQPMRHAPAPAETLAFRRCVIRTPRFFSIPVSCPDRPLPHPRDAVERETPSPQRAQRRQKPDRRPAVPAEQLSRRSIDLPAAPMHTHRPRIIDRSTR